MRAMFDDDMTFCTADCAMKEHCYRNPKLIKEPQYPHSYADFSKNCMAYQPTINLFIDLMFDKETQEQFLKECEQMGIKADCPWK